MHIQLHSMHIHHVEVSLPNQVRQELAAVMVPVEMVVAVATIAHQAVEIIHIVLHRMQMELMLLQHQIIQTMQLQQWPYSVRMYPHQAF